jgi:hypothetical protein
MQMFGCAMSGYAAPADAWSPNRDFRQSTPASSIQQPDQAPGCFFGQYAWGPEGIPLHNFFDLIENFWPQIHVFTYPSTIPFRAEDFVNTLDTFVIQGEVLPMNEIQMDTIPTETEIFIKKFISLIIRTVQNTPKLMMDRNRQYQLEMLRNLETVPWYGERWFSRVGAYELSLVLAVMAPPQAPFMFGPDGVNYVQVSIHTEGGDSVSRLRNPYYVNARTAFSGMMFTETPGDRNLWQTMSAKAATWFPQALIKRRINCIAEAEQFNMFVQYMSMNLLPGERRFGQRNPFDDIQRTTPRRQTSVMIKDDFAAMAKSRFGYCITDNWTSLQDYRLQDVKFTMVRFNGEEREIALNMNPQAINYEQAFIYQRIFNHPNIFQLSRKGFVITYSLQTHGWDGLNSPWIGEIPDNHRLDQVKFNFDQISNRVVLMNAIGVMEPMQGTWALSQKAATTGLALLLREAMGFIRNQTFTLVVESEWYHYNEKYISVPDRTYDQSDILLQYLTNSTTGIILPEFCRVMPTMQGVPLPYIYNYFQPLENAGEATVCTFPYAIDNPANMDVMPNPDDYAVATQPSIVGETQLPDTIGDYIYVRRYKAAQVPIMIANPQITEDSITS